MVESKNGMLTITLFTIDWQSLNGIKNIWWIKNISWNIWKNARGKIFFSKIQMYYILNNRLQFCCYYHQHWKRIHLSPLFVLICGNSHTCFLSHFLLFQKVIHLSNESIMHSCINDQLVLKYTTLCSFNTLTCQKTWISSM